MLVWLAVAPSADTRATQPYVGITLIERTEAAPRPVRMHIAQIDLSAPGLRFMVSAPAGPREAVRQTTLEFLRQQKAQLAINAHFFLPFPSTDTDSWVIGLAASEGRVYSAFEIAQQSFAIVANAPALNIDSRNRARIVRRDQRKADGLQVRERVRLWNAVSGSAQIVTEGTVTIPRYVDAPRQRALLTPGTGFSAERSWYDVANARTVVGLSRNNRTLTLFTVDRNGGSEGMRVGEVAALLVKEYGVWNALNLDGGGSTSMAWQDPATGETALLNTSSDNPAGRAVATSLAVFARRR